MHYWVWPVKDSGSGTSWLYTNSVMVTLSTQYVTETCPWHFLWQCYVCYSNHNRFSLVTQSHWLVIIKRHKIMPVKHNSKSSGSNNLMITSIISKLSQSKSNISLMYYINWQTTSFCNIENIKEYMKQHASTCMCIMLQSWHYHSSIYFYTRWRKPSLLWNTLHDFNINSQAVMDYLTWLQS